MEVDLFIIPSVKVGTMLHFYSFLIEYFALQCSLKVFP